MTAPNPTMRVGDQISEVIRKQNNVNRIDAAKKGLEILEMVGIEARRSTDYPTSFPAA